MAKKSANIAGQMSWKEHDSSEMLISGAPEAEIIDVTKNSSSMLGSQSEGMLQDESDFNVDLSPDSIEETLSSLGFSHDQCRVVADMSFSDRQRVMEQVTNVVSNRKKVGSNRSRADVRNAVSVVGSTGVSVGSGIGNGIGGMRSASESENEAEDLSSWMKGSLEDVANSGKDRTSSIYRAMRSDFSVDKHDPTGTVTKWVGHSSSGVDETQKTQSGSIYQRPRSSVEQLVSKSRKNNVLQASGKQSRKAFSRMLSRALPGVGVTGATAAGGAAAGGAAAAGAGSTTAAAAGGSGAAAGGAAAAGAAAGGGATAAAGSSASSPVGIVIAAIAGVFVVGCFVFLLVIAAIFMFSGGGTSSVSVGSLEGAEREVAQYLIDLGWDAVPIAAVMGNIDNECEKNADGSWNPASDENMSGMFNYSYEVACGLFQYTSTSHNDGEYWNFKNYCSANGLDWTSVKVQMDWTFGENQDFGSNWKTRWSDNLARKGYYANDTGYPGGWNSTPDAFLAETDLGVATFSWMACYEKPANGQYSHLDRRITSAQNYYAILTASSYTGGSEIVDRAYSQLGKPYVWGAAGPNSFDCSGLVSYCVTGQFSHIYTTYSIYFNTDGHWQDVIGDPQPGDIWVNDDGYGNGHTGVYIGDGQFIEAPHTGDVVKISPVRTYGKYMRYVG